MRKKKNKKTVADTGYKKVDRKEKKKKEKQEEKRRQKKLSVQQSIAYKEMGRDGICRVQGKTYSKCIRFYDINYQLAQNEDKNAIFENWCDFLNYFDASIHFQLSFINHKSSMKEFEQVIRIRPQDDAFDDVRMEYAKMLKQQLAKGNNGLVKSKYITFSIEADNIREAKPKLERIESDILNNFKILGVPAYPLNGVERLQILYETFNPDIMTDFQFDYGSMIRTGLNVRYNKKTCPEETLYQLGTLDKHASAEILVEIFEELKKEFEERFGSHVHIIDWALHMDEATSHSAGMKIYSDASVSDFFKSITKDKSTGFLNEWNAKRNRRKRIYISYDSTNKNCQAGEIELAEFGHAKTDIGSAIINYSVGYDLKNKEPLFYEAYPGSINDVCSEKESGIFFEGIFKSGLPVWQLCFSGTKGAEDKRV